MQRRRAPCFLRLPHGGTSWDLVVHASIHFSITAAREFLHDPVIHAMPYSVCMVAAGRGQLSRGGQTWPLQRGSLFLVNPQGSTRIMARSSESLSVNRFSFNLRSPETAEDLTAPLADILADWADEVLVIRDGPVLLNDLQTVEFIELVSSLNRHFLPNREVEWFPLHRRAFDILAFTVDAFATTDSEGISVDPAMHRVRDYIERNYAEPLPLSELAVVAGLSSYYLVRRFKAVYGVTPQRHQQQLRIRAACSYLRSTEWRVKEIAAHVGYPVTEHFSRLFRLRTGVSPRAYRRGVGSPVD